MIELGRSGRWITEKRHSWLDKAVPRLTSTDSMPKPENDSQVRFDPITIVKLPRRTPRRITPAPSKKVA